MDDVIALAHRVPLILLFLFCLTIVAECADATGVFDSAGRRIVRAARGRIATVWWAHVALSALVTAFLSLDTTAVLMTSAGVVLARRVGRPVTMFAFPTLWLANMASLWLPVSNLTNLLAHDVLPRAGSLAFLGAIWPVALTTTLVPVACAALIWRHRLTGTIDTTSAGSSMDEEADHPARRPVGLVIVAMCVAILVIEPAVAAAVAAAACVGAVAMRERVTLRSLSLPWRSLLLTCGLFAAVAALQAGGVLDTLVGRLATAPDWQLAGAGAAVANLTNNLPTYLALEPAAGGDESRIIALLIGVNVASGLTWWGSVATLLWRERLRRAGEHVTWREHLALTGTVTVVTTSAALIVLALAG